MCVKIDKTKQNNSVQNMIVDVLVNITKYCRLRVIFIYKIKFIKKLLLCVCVYNIKQNID